MPARSRQRAPHPTRWIAPALVALLTFVAFLPTLTNGFVTWDDDRNFLDNPSYRGLSPENLHWMWTTFHMGHYVPLSWMTLGLDYELWGMDARGYHFTSLLLHCINAVLLYFVAARLLRGRSDDRTTQLGAAFAALLFSVHPLRVESVAWVTERRDVLSGVLVAASLLCYGPWAVGRKPWGASYWLSLGFFLCALLSKATALTLPGVLLLLNVYPYRRLGGEAGWTSSSAREVYREIIPFAVLGALTIPLTIAALAPPQQLTLPAKIAVSAYSLAFYLWKSVVPSGLSPLYAMPIHVHPFELRFVLSYAVVIAVVGLAFVARRKYPGATLAALVFITITLPMLGIVQNGPQIAADRYTYHASPALAILAAGAVLPFLNGLTRWLFAGVIVAFMALTWRQTTVWHDSRTLWTYVLSRDSTSAVAETALGTLELDAGRPEAATTYYLRAVGDDSTYFEAHDNLGVALSRQGKYAEAIPHFERALMLNAQNPETHNNLGVAEANLGRLDAAMQEYQEALEINPKFASAQVNWGNALVRAGRVDESIAHYAEAARLQPQNADAHFNWAVALARAGRMDDAVTEFRAALAVDPNHAEAKDYLAKAIAMRDGKQR